MKLITYQAPGLAPGAAGASELGVVHAGRVGGLAALARQRSRPELAEPLGSARAFLAAGEAAADAARALLAEAVADGSADTWPALESLRLRAPVPDPRKLFALAGNYRAHIREGGGAVIPKEQRVPEVFVKPVTCVVGSGAAIQLPGDICTSVDYEGELGVVVGRVCRSVPPERALDYVGGYLNLNDVSGRRLNIPASRERTPRTAYFDWLAGKWFDSFAPMGPWLLLAAEVPDPQALDLELRVNGQVRQRASTGDMIHTVAETVAWISRFVTLEPGDVIATGTPSGVGATTETYLQAGDVVELEITGLGVLRNPVAAPV